MKFRTAILPLLSAVALALATVPAVASAATLGTVTSQSPLSPGNLNSAGMLQTLDYTCPGATSVGGPGGTSPSVTIDGQSVTANGIIGCGTSMPGQVQVNVPDTISNSASVTVNVFLNGAEVATGQIQTTPANLSIQPTPSEGKTGTYVKITGSGISAEDGKAGVTIGGKPATVTSWYAGAVIGQQIITVQVPQCVTLGPGQLTLTTANGSSASAPFTVTSATCDGKVEGSASGSSGTGGGTTTSGSSTTTTHTTTTTTGTGGTGTSNKTGTTSSTPSTGYAIAGPASLSVGGQGAYSLLPPPSKGTITWLTSNPSTATVSPSGVVTSHHAGSVTISATSGGKSASKTITVTPASSGGSSKGTGTGSGVTTPPSHQHKGGLPGWLMWLLIVLLLIVLLVLLQRPLRRLRERLGKRVHDGLSGARDEDTDKGTAQDATPDTAPKDNDK